MPKEDDDYPRVPIRATAVCFKKYLCLGVFLLFFAFGTVIIFASSSGNISNVRTTTDPIKAVDSLTKASTKYWMKQITKEGDKLTFPHKGDGIRIHYTGTLADGSVFDNSREDGRTPLEGKIGIGSFIRGWDGCSGDGNNQVLMQSLGERALVSIKPEYAYGKRGYPPVIPPDATLLFDMELLNITSTTI